MQRDGNIALPFCFVLASVCLRMSVCVCVCVTTHILDVKHVLNSRPVFLVEAKIYHGTSLVSACLGPANCSLVSVPAAPQACCRVLHSHPPGSVGSCVFPELEGPATLGVIHRAPQTAG